MNSHLDIGNLDLSKFTEDERNIILELKDILDDEDLEEDNKLLNESISYNNRVVLYNKESIRRILQDVKDNLISRLYDDKKEVLQIFKLVIDLYKKYTICTIRNQMINELSHISNDFNSIINFINKIYQEHENVYQDELEIKSYLARVKVEYLPIVEELISKDYYDDDYYDTIIEDFINKCKIIIKKWKEIMTNYYQQDTKVKEISENTDNLVFCISNIDLSQPGFQKEFINTVLALEYKSSQELKMRKGRKGMSKIRKSMDNHKEKDFSEFMRIKYGSNPHFVPYRYSSIGSYRTGLIKFEPTSIVKEFLEERYGLSKQSAYYGIFMIISAEGANHNDYYYLENYLLNNYKYLEELAMMFASENPDFDKLVEIIDKLLAMKKEKIELISNSKSL